MPYSQKVSYGLLITVLMLLVSCGGGSGSSSSGGNLGSATNNSGPSRFTISGIVSGVSINSSTGADKAVSFSLSSSGVGAGLNPAVPGTTVITELVTTDGVFSFDASLVEGDVYTISIVASDESTSCFHSAGQLMGTMPASNVVNLRFSCFSNESEVQGLVSASEGIIVDSDINDPSAVLVDNSSFVMAQPIINPVVLQGFLSFEGTGNVLEGDAFALVPDVDDFYSVSLNEGQVINLKVIDHDSDGQYQGDLDLFLYDQEYKPVAFSIEQAEFEEIVVPADGEYYINVNAHVGTSSYVLRVMEGSSAAPVFAQSLNFVPGQAIISLVEDDFESQRRSNEMLSELWIRSSQYTGQATDTLLVSFDTFQTEHAYSRSGLNYSRQLSSLVTGEGDDKVETLKHIKRLQESEEFAYVQPNYLRNVDQTVPDDSAYSRQWSLDTMNLPEAWDISTGEPDSGDVIVAVVDTGIFLTHDDLQNKLLPGFDFVADLDAANDGDGIDSDPSDPGDGTRPRYNSWHGTHVAGIIAAQTNNSEAIAGVSWDAKIMPVRVLGVGGGTVYDILQGVLYAAGLPNDSGTVPAQRADIINLSLGGGDSSDYERDVLQQVYEAGVIVVASAGNDNSSSDHFPSGYDSVISVSALTLENTKASYSNFGHTVDFSAPGGELSQDVDADGYPDGILSTTVSWTNNQRVPALGFKHGTSMSAPHVSGMLALMKAVYPALTPDDVKLLLANGMLTEDLGQSGYDEIYGFGLADAKKSVDIALALRNGAVIPSLPAPDLFAVPSNLEIGTDDFGDIKVFNHGREVSLDCVCIDEDNFWIVAEERDEYTGMSTIRITPNKTGLSLGSHSSHITLQFSDGSEIEVPVTITIETPDASGQTGQFYSVLVAENNQFGHFGEVEISKLHDNASYSVITNVPAGSYFVYSGSDIDNDGIICEAGDICGSYPVLVEPHLLHFLDAESNTMDVSYQMEVLREPLRLPLSEQEGIPR